MKGWFLTAPQKMELLDIPEPELKPGFVLVEVLTAQASVTEVNMLNDPAWHEKQFRNNKGPIALPCHELCARVIATNPDSRFQVGDRVGALAVAYCGECAPCRAGVGQNCQNKWRLGVGYNGGFQERTLLNEKMLVKLPDNVTDSEAANLQPASDCVCFIESANMRLGDTVAVFGGGCLGMFTMQIARATGAGKTIVVDVKEDILRLAKQFGATYTINGAEEDAVKRILELTDGIGADLVVEAAGGNPKRGLSGTQTLNQAVLATRPEGTVFLAAVHGETVEFPIGAIRMKGKRVCTPIHTQVKYLQRAADLMSRKQLQVAPMVTHSFTGIEHVPDIIEVTGNKKKYGCLNPAQVVINR